MAWFLVGGLGTLVIALFLFLLFWRKANFDAPLLGLMTLGVSLCVISILKPDTMKVGVGTLEMARLQKQADNATIRSEQASKDAEKARIFSAETMAFLLWNTGRAGFGGEFQEKMATSVLRDVYGEKADQLVHALQHRGVFRTPSDELKKVPNDSIPLDIDSPILKHFSTEFKMMQEENRKLDNQK